MTKRNTTFTILSAIAMTMVVLGHLDCHALTIWGLFPYYSYHVMTFVFIAGYFYKPESEDSIFKYIGHKAKTLLLPYFIWNVIYGIIATVLHGYGFTIGEDISLWNIFVAPAIGGHQFMYNAAAWFVPALFILEVCNVIGRKLLGLIKIKQEWVITILYLMIGVFTVFMAKRGSVYDYYKIPGRIMLMAPMLQFGRLYRVNEEKMDRVSPVVYLVLAIVMNLILHFTHGGLAYSVVWVTGFANTVFTPFITAVTGTMLWLSVAKFLTSFVENNDNMVTRAINYYGSNTFAVMMHQLLMLMVVKLILSTARIPNFDMELYHSDVYYTPGNTLVKLVIALVVIILSLMLQYAIDGIKGKIKNKR